MSTRREYGVTLGVIAVVLVLCGMYTWHVITQEVAPDNPVVQALADNETQAGYTDIDGVAVSLLAGEQKVMVVNAWASWSPDSRTELFDLAKLVDQYGDQISVVAINRAEPSSTAKRFLKAVGAADKVQLVLDSEDRFYQSVEGYAMPETVIYAASGNIIHHHRGVMTYDDMVRYVEMALAEKE